jgi:excisionase family DNA binding protein
MAEEFVSLDQAARLVGLNKRTLRRRVAQGVLPAYRSGPRVIRIKVADLEKLWQRIPTAGAGDAA